MTVDRAGECEAVCIGQGCFKVSRDLILIDYYAVNEIIDKLLAVLSVTRSYPLRECAYHLTKHFLVDLGIDPGLRNTVSFFFKPAISSLILIRSSRKMLLIAGAFCV